MVKLTVIVFPIHHQNNHLQCIYTKKIFQYLLQKTIPFVEDYDNVLESSVEFKYIIECLNFNWQNIIKTINRQSDHMTDNWLPEIDNIFQPIVKIPLKFQFEPVQILSKELTKLNANSPYRIHYLGPRWENSVALHKKLAAKHGYQFNERQLNLSNNFLSETMSNNQFYRNQVFYRAFEGPNPTINKQQQMLFDSKFESGNLDCVVKVDQNQYDLFLRVDSNTRGHLFWFYFQVSNCKPGNTVKLNICNMTKSIVLYKKGFKPYSCVKDQNGYFPHKKWSQQKCQKVTVQNKKLRYDFIYERTKVRSMFELSFQYTFDSDRPVRFAYCVPYTYTDMLRDTKKLGNHAFVRNIGRSLTGLQIPAIKIQDTSQTKEENENKAVFVIIGRLHPGESCGSHVLASFIKFLALSPQASYLRKKIVTIIVPMMNPDGVVLGNSRTGAAGKDLNRQFKSKNRFLFPEIHLLKNLVRKIDQTHDIEMFLDFHGHSRKKNMFLFGPNYNLTQPQYYQCRVMPKYLSQLTSVFRFFGCDYRLPPGKNSTARGVMLNQFCIPFVYTVETSVGLFYDYEQLKDMAFTVEKWQNIGINILKAVRSYFQSIEQYEQFMKMKKYENQQIKKIKNTPNKVGRSDKNQVISTSGASRNKNNFTIKDLKLLKIFQEIKNSEEAKKNQQEKIDDGDSDSEDQADNLQKNKRSEFQGMITQCIEAEKRRKQIEDKHLNGKIKIDKDRTRSNQIRKRDKKNKNDEMGFLKKYMGNFSSEKKPYSSNKINLNSKNNEKYGRNFRNISFDEGFSGSAVVDQRMNKQGQSQSIYATNNTYFDSQFPLDLQFKKKRQRLNMRMFNFSKVLQETEVKTTKNSTATATAKKREKNKRYQKNQQQVIKNSFPQSNDYQTFPSALDNQNKFNRYLRLNYETTLSTPYSHQPQQETSIISPTKKKGVFPAPFYRIKYQSHQRKKQKYLQEKYDQTLIESSQYQGETKRRDQDYSFNSNRKELRFLNIKNFDEKY